MNFCFLVLFLIFLLQYKYHINNQNKSYRVYLAKFQQFSSFQMH